MAEFNAKQQLPGLLDWMRAQMKACGGKTAVIGISGGKDSSVTAALSVAAYGRENVVGVLMPATTRSIFTAARAAFSTRWRVWASRRAARRR